MTVAACLNAPAVLTGIAEPLVANLVSRWQRALAPDQLEAIARLERAAAVAWQRPATDPAAGGAQPAKPAGPARLNQ